MHGYVHLSLQDGWITLMVASNTGKVECVKILLDRGARVNMQNEVSCVIIDWVHAMQAAHTQSPQ